MKCLLGKAWEGFLKAIVVREFGPPNVMKYEDVPTPEPGPGEVLIKVHAVSVNRTLDTVVRAGKYARRVSLPLTPGVDPSGTVAKVGPDVTVRKVGDRVTVQLRSGNESGADSIRNLGLHAWGGYAEYVRCEASRTAIVPEGLDFATATVVSRTVTVTSRSSRLLPGGVCASTVGTPKANTTVTSSRGPGPDPLSRLIIHFTLWRIVFKLKRNASGRDDALTIADAMSSDSDVLSVKEKREK